MQDIFGTAILVQFGIGGWILCMAAYKMIGVSTFLTISSFIMFFFIILELFIHYSGIPAERVEYRVCINDSLHYMHSH